LTGTAVGIRRAKRNICQGAVVRNAIAIAFQKIWRFIRTAITTSTTSTDAIAVRHASILIIDALAIELYTGVTSGSERAGDLIAIDTGTVAVAVIFTAACEQHTEAERNGRENELSAQHDEIEN
jgi:hypothetical protein